MNMKKKIISIALIFILMLSFCCSIFANTEEELKQNIEENENEIEEIKQEKQSTMNEIQDITSTINQYEDEIRVLKRKIEKLEASISENNAKIKKLQKQYEEKEQLLRNRLVALYIAGETTYLDVLLTSDDLTDLISNYYLMQKLAEADNDLLTSIENEKKQIQEVKQKLENEKIEVDTAKEELDRKNESLKAQKAEKQSRINTLDASQKKLQDEIDAMEAELDKIYEQSAYVDYGEETYSGELAWPVPSYGKDWITSPFGYRVHPIYGYYSGHRGLDIGGNYGSTIIAAEDGVVVDINTSCGHNYGKSYSCGCGGGYGNYVEINHSSGLTTLYGHLQKVYVSVGEHVTRGQPIAEMGSTGSSTGVHLHFEVIINGSPQNPIEYV